MAKITKFFCILALLASVGLSACAMQGTIKGAESSSALNNLLGDSKKPAVIKFHAKWCGTCKQYEPTFLGAKATFSDSVDFYSIDIEENKEIAREFKISRIPATAFISSDRATITKRLGPLSLKSLKAMIDNLKTL